MKYVLINSSTGRDIAQALDRPKTAWGRLIGLLLKTHLLFDQGMWFDDCGAVHTVGMRMEIDIIFLDGDGRVCRLAPNVQPGLPHVSHSAAKTVIEMRSGFIESRDMLVGDRLELRPCEATLRSSPRRCAEELQSITR